MELERDVAKYLVSCRGKIIKHASFFDLYTCKSMEKGHYHQVKANKFPITFTDVDLIKTKVLKPDVSITCQLALRKHMSL